MNEMNGQSGLSRRTFLAGSAASAALLSAPAGVFAQGSDRLKVGLVGCGGRGTGAMVDALNADPGTVVWSVGDVFPDRVERAIKQFESMAADRVMAPADRRFVGFDAYQKVIDSGVDIVILTTPPGFRPIHLDAAIKAGKHVFMEKPVAVDAPGIRSVIASAELAQQKKLNIVAGTQRRHALDYRETMDRILNGDIGEVVATYGYWIQGGLWMVKREPNMSDMEWQLRNWLYFAWLSGDHIVEQHVHNIDVCLWAKGGKLPVRAISLGGRQVRTDPAYGHIYDHFATEFEFEDGSKMTSWCRQIDGTVSRVSEQIVGTKGTSNASSTIKGEKPFRYDGERPNPYMLEHKNLIAGVRGGKYINEGKQVAHSCMAAIMGRMAGYTGQEVTWEDAMKSNVSLVPTSFSMGDKLEVPPVAVPGKSRDGVL